MKVLTDRVVVPAWDTLLRHGLFGLLAGVDHRWVQLGPGLRPGRGAARRPRHAAWSGTGVPDGLFGRVMDRSLGLFLAVSQLPELSGGSQHFDKLTIDILKRFLGR